MLCPQAIPHGNKARQTAASSIHSRSFQTFIHGLIWSVKMDQIWPRTYEVPADLL